MTLHAYYFKVKSWYFCNPVLNRLCSILLAAYCSCDKKWHFWTYYVHTWSPKQHSTDCTRCNFGHLSTMFTFKLIDYNLYKINRLIDILSLICSKETIQIERFDENKAFISKDKKYVNLSRCFFQRGGHPDHILIGVVKTPWNQKWCPKNCW
jgi:hypothetical protein